MPLGAICSLIWIVCTFSITKICMSFSMWMICQQPTKVWRLQNDEIDKMLPNQQKSSYTYSLRFKLKINVDWVLFLPIKTNSVTNCHHQKLSISTPKLTILNISGSIPIFKNPYLGPIATLVVEYQGKIIQFQFQYTMNLKSYGKMFSICQTTWKWSCRATIVILDTNVMILHIQYMYIYVIKLNFCCL